MSTASTQQRVETSSGHPLSCSFNGSVKVVGSSSSMTAHAGVLALREVDQRLGLSRSLAERITDTRDPQRVTHQLDELLRARLLLMAAGHRDQDDVDQLRDDPVLRLAACGDRGNGVIDRELASQPTQSRLVEMLTSPENRAALDDGLIDWSAQAFRALTPRHRRDRGVVIDLDALPIGVHGNQDGAWYSAHYGKRCYSALCAMLRGTETWVKAELRPGTQHCSDGAVDFLQDLIPKVEEKIAPVRGICGDAGFPDEDMLSMLEEAGTPYAFRITNYTPLQKMAEPYLRRPPGPQPSTPREWYVESTYQAAAWSKLRRVVLVLVEKPGELFLDYFWILTSWTPKQLNGGRLIDFYRRRGRMEACIGELNTALAPRLSSVNRPKTHIRNQTIKHRSEPRNVAWANHVTFVLFAFAYNLGTTTSHLLTAGEGNGSSRSLRSVQDWIIRTPARITRTARRIIVHLTRPVEEAIRKLWRVLETAQQRLHALE